MSVLTNYYNVENKIKKITQRNIQIVAVSKYAKDSDVNSLYQSGIRIFGENRVENALNKQGTFPDSHWHMIGSLQTRKVKDIIGKFKLIHSLDRENLAQEIEKRSAQKEVITNCLVQVNISKEESKSGLHKEEVLDFMKYLEDFKWINVKGLMTMAPFTDNPEEVRYVFKDLANLQRELITKGFTNITELSMGMSNDYLVAIEEGATIVRIGSEIFSN
ncbi:YggS family pyridoxal phosphate-dependent enzyme [Alkalicella caledoniensis]|uniref:Pyridoxal phosphate homeostasis protein n=1 Tax=Alkalicella caledoniensis TaxID=2731377 RepID=A0A7G9WCA8_ALKCA|nr:YggS family pyridoxal phosphate-dependent enzyme [Alkalicella caledoniensis]QNO16320.1 YggS family pyridoxal phosphate-dependent enzyme [Alkalicella caledoniensis]